MKDGLILADPAGNITAFVLNAERYTIMERRKIAASLTGRRYSPGLPAPAGTADMSADAAEAIADAAEAIAEAAEAIAEAIAEAAGWPPVEQTGFVFSPLRGGGVAGLNGVGASGGCGASGGSVFWRLEMAGGEFCGNAARSFGLLVASGMAGEPSDCRGGRRGVSGHSGLVTVSVSGADTPLDVSVEWRPSPPPYTAGVIGTASVAIPPPLCRGVVFFAGAEYSVYFFPGITHLIAPDTAAGKDIFFALKAACEASYGEQAAFGVLFTDAAYMRPAVYIRRPETFVFESSCGSGAAALACHWFEKMTDGEAAAAVRQPGGVIDVTLVKRGGVVTNVRIGGPARLSGILPAGI